MQVAHAEELLVEQGELLFEGLGLLVQVLVLGLELG